MIEKSNILIILHFTLCFHTRIYSEFSYQKLSIVMEVPAPPTRSIGSPQFCAICRASLPCNLTIEIDGTKYYACAVCHKTYIDYQVDEDKLTEESKCFFCNEDSCDSGACLYHQREFDAQAPKNNKIKLIQSSMGLNTRRAIHKRNTIKAEKKRKIEAARYAKLIDDINGAGISSIPPPVSFGRGLGIGSAQAAARPGAGRGMSLGFGVPGIPGVGTPGIGTPGARTLGVGTPGAGTPGAGTPGAGTPGAGTPGAGTPLRTL
jgi:hypothetical protein